MTEIQDAIDKDTLIEDLAHEVERLSREARIARYIAGIAGIAATALFAALIL